MKKLIFGFLAISLGLTICQCTPDAIRESITIIMDAPLNFEGDGDSMTFTLTTTTPWSASSDQLWCKVSPTSGQAGTFTITVTVDADPTKAGRPRVATRATTETRTAIITITADGEQKEITVTQEVTKTPPETQEVDVIYRFTNAPFIWTDTIIEDGTISLSNNAITTSSASLNFSGVYTNGGGTFDIDDGLSHYIWAYLYDADGKIGFAFVEDTLIGRAAVIGKTACETICDWLGITGIDRDDMQDDYNCWGDAGVSH